MRAPFYPQLDRIGMFSYIRTKLHPIYTCIQQKKYKLLFHAPMKRDLKLCCLQYEKYMSSSLMLQPIFNHYFFLNSLSLNFTFPFHTVFHTIYYLVNDNDDSVIKCNKLIENTFYQHDFSIFKSVAQMFCLEIF